MGISSSASKAEIKKSYRTLALEWHPDRFGSSGHLASSREEAERKIAEINEAYTALIGRFLVNSNHGDATSSFEISKSLKRWFEENKEVKNLFDLFSNEGKREFCKDWEEREMKRTKGENWTWDSPTNDSQGKEGQGKLIITKKSNSSFLNKKNFLIIVGIMFIIFLTLILLRKMRKNKF